MMDDDDDDDDNNNSGMTTYQNQSKQVMEVRLPYYGKVTISW